MNTRRLTGFLALVLGAVLSVPSSHAADIQEQSEFKRELVSKLTSVLMVGTSSRNTERDLGNKQAIVGAEVRKLLKARGIEVFPLGIRPEDASPQTTVDESVRKHSPTHVLSLTVPKGTVFVSKLSGKQIAARDYVIRVDINDAKTGDLVWEYIAEVQATFGASNAQVAEAIVSRLRTDGFIP